MIWVFHTSCFTFPCPFSLNNILSWPCIAFFPIRPIKFVLKTGKGKAPSLLAEERNSVTKAIAMVGCLDGYIAIHVNHVDAGLRGETKEIDIG
jgi:hypothetical protein